MRRGSLIILLAIAVAIAVASEGGARDKPSFGCDRFVRPCGKVYELGRHTWFNGPVVIKAYSSGIGLCVEIEHLDGGSGSCGGDGRPYNHEPIVIDGLATSTGGAGDPSYTEVIGALLPGAEHVAIRYQRNGKRHLVDAFVIQVDEALARKLGEKRPFGILEATVRGCVPGQRFRAIAYAADGTRLGEARGFRTSCHRYGPGVPRRVAPAISAQRVVSSAPSREATTP